MKGIQIKNILAYLILLTTNKVGINADFEKKKKKEAIRGDIMALIYFNKQFHKLCFENFIYMPLLKR